MTPGTKMALVASEYTPTCFILTPVGNGTLTVLKRDPRRLYVEFRPWGAAQYPVIYPGQIPEGAVGGTLTSERQVYKYHDSPGIVTGDFLMIADGAVGSVLVITDTYVGD